MNNGDLTEKLATHSKADACGSLCMPCAVSDKQFRERITGYIGPWDGPDRPSAWINGRAYHLVCSPAPLKTRCARCGEETHWAYVPESTQYQREVPVYTRPCSGHATPGFPPKDEGTCGKDRTLLEAAVYLTVLLRQVALDAVLVQTHTGHRPDGTVTAGSDLSNASAQNVESAIDAVRQAIEAVEEIIQFMDEQANDLPDGFAGPDIGKKGRSPAKRRTGLDKAA